MGFFSDLKEDLSQAVNELMPEEDLKAPRMEPEPEEAAVQEEAATYGEEVDLAGMLDHLDTVSWQKTEPEAAEEPWKNR